MAKPQHHYVDNKLLFETLVEYRQSVKACPNDPPPIPEYVGECLLKIATRLSQKANFASYTFREDMVSDAIENCIMYMHNFDPAKSSNPFAYFTQIAHYAFIRRIEREKKQVYTKLKYAMHKAHQREDYVTQDGESTDLKNPTWLSYENIHEFIRDYETKLTTSRSSRVSVEEDDEAVTFDTLADDSSVEYERGLDGEVERLSGDEEEDTTEPIEEL